MIRGIPEVPLGIKDAALRRHLQDMRECLLEIRSSQAPPNQPSNFKITPQAFGNLIAWTRAVNADFYEVLWNTTPQIKGAVIVSVGNSQQWMDNIGQAAVKRWYWVRSGKNTGARSIEIGPIAGTSLAAGTGVTPPTVPVSHQVPVLDQTRNYNVVPVITDKAHP